MATSTPDPSSMSRPTTCAATPSVISSPASAAGPRLCDGPEFGRIIDRFGRVAVLASLSPSRARAVGLLTSGTSGLSGSTSSSSAALQRSLESSLRMHLRGSDLCEVIWKPWTTPWGACLSKPQARVRTTFEIDISLWATLTEKGNYNRKGLSPKAGDGLATQVLALWATLRATDGEKGGPRMKFSSGQGAPLPSQVSEVGSSFNVLMENGGRSLHAEFGGWELGFPPEWLSCAPSAMPSTSARPPRSSRRSTKA
jgi:hypothetical protein